MNRRFVGVCLGIMLVGCCWAVLERHEPEGRPNLTGLEQAAAEGRIQQLTANGPIVSVWAKDFEAVEPALRSCDCEIQLMRGKEQVGTFTRRAGIQLRGE